MQGAIAGGTLATAFSVWMVVGNFLYDPHNQPLPTRIDMCNNTALNGFYVNGNFSVNGVNDYESRTSDDLMTSVYGSTQMMSSLLYQQTTTSTPK
jgi:hypothetical protein